jgi:hypothetical protein
VSRSRNPDAEVGDEELYGPTLGGSADADVMQPAVMAQADAIGIDLVLAGPEVGVR